MRKRVFILLSVILALAACTHSSYNTQLVSVDSLLKSHPDSALLQLRTMSFSSEADRMYHTLLLADAANKCYDTLPSDSLLREVAEFYDRHGTSNEQVRAHYLLGCAYRDLGEAPQALDCFHDAIDRADTTATDCDYRLMMSVYGQMAELYHKQNLPHDEIEAQRMSGHYDLLNHDTIGYIRSTELMAKAFGIIGDTAKVLEYIDKSQQLYRELGYPFMAIRENVVVIHYYIQSNQLEKARKLMTEYEEESRLFDDVGNIAKGRESYYYIKGNYFQKCNQLDSSLYYMHKLLLSGNKVDAYRGLFTTHQLFGNSDSVLKYACLYEEALDSLNNIKRTEAVHQMTSMYNYQRYQKIAYQKSEAAEKARSRMKVTIVVFVLIMMSLLFMYMQYRKTKQEEIRQLNNDYGLALLEYNKKTAELEFIRQNDNSLILEKEQEIGLLKEKIRKYQQQQHLIRVSQNLSEFKKSQIIALFKNKSKINLKLSLPDIADWEKLVKCFSQTVPSVYSALGRDVILSPSELRVCILLLAGFKISDMAILLNSTPQSLTNIRSKANKKLFGEDTATTLERNLMKTIGMV